ncbi:hypothetical protein [Variovorax sp. 160MFSha2.1]|uniref:hypothetical protein n=1 Tax=Variovorax sp. 160MFSha2.1 TaxID=3158367 RepID=UPI003AABE34F
MIDKTNPNEWPTKEMISAGMKRMFDEKRYMAPWDDVIALVFTDMLAAAPKEACAPLTAAQIEILQFLVGTGELGGFGFGEQPPGERGRFWWRKALRQAFPNVPFMGAGEESNV